MRELCKKAGITYNQIRDALRDKGIKEHLGLLGTFTHPLYVGQRGYFSEMPWTEQIINKENVIVKTSISYKRDDSYDSGLVFSPIRPLVWLKGMVTSGLVDKSKITCSQFLEITGTKTYTTADGASNTIFVMQPFLSPVDK